MSYNWRQPFESLEVPVVFEQAEKNEEAIGEHLGRLSASATTLLFITPTSIIEAYVLAAQRQIANNTWPTWIVFTKDTQPFKCLRCLNAQIYWARIVKSWATEELANFADFVYTEELDTQFLFARNTQHHVQTSYCLDIIYTALKAIFVINDTLVDVPVDPIMTPAPDAERNETINFILRNVTDYDFGLYELHYA